ncbi:hypothetical protein LA303_08890 [Candidatus Sulfidibacterium hydrothermale]|uniref:hypothetical protein n=1 Tax=Candidatus Sulfidibacterium hydrothermale TaxID=2875962 RepID=UPI001F0A417D|nr:hypothetical protein [Candidatus Sulfidibacterium hydrothermale]UBM61531.1 hypothetical protein LA303_08890 [Candidatus Sulfidibacterium hydrothermale]
MMEIDDQFIFILKDKINNIKNSEGSGNYIRIINSGTLENIGRYIDNLRPKSKYRKYKHQILEFVDILENNRNLSKKEVAELIQTYLSEIFIFLGSKHSFIDRYAWFSAGEFNLVLDAILIFVGIGKYYYYIPIFTITAVIRNILKQRKAKKEGKYLDF